VLDLANPHLFAVDHLGGRLLGDVSTQTHGLEHEAELPALDRLPGLSHLTSVHTIE
jgi:hypothetical protein